MGKSRRRSTRHRSRRNWMASMTDRDRVQLLFGRYQAPPLKRGDRAFCLFRDCAVVITIWTDSPIPWPRGCALDSHGGSGLRVDEELTAIHPALVAHQHPAHPLADAVPDSVVQA